MSEAGDVLKTARAMLERAWVKGFLTAESNSHCMVGAVRKALYGNAHQPVTTAVGHEVMELLARHLPWMPKVPYPDWDWAQQVIPFFNDHPSTVKEDVLTVFDKALAELGEI